MGLIASQQGRREYFSLGPASKKHENISQNRGTIFKYTASNAITLLQQRGGGVITTTFVCQATRRYRRQYMVPIRWSPERCANTPRRKYLETDGSAFCVVSEVNISLRRDRP